VPECAQRPRLKQTITQPRISIGYTAAAVAKILVSIPDDLLDRVDREAQRRHMTRSALLQQAAQHELGWPDSALVDAALDRARSALAGVEGFESVAVIRRERERRDAHDRRRR
jgi:predicted transcriptional regulator